MKKLLLIVLANLMMTTSVFARDTIGDYSVEEAMSSEKAKAALGDQVKFYFGDTGPANAAKQFGEFRTNKKTNAFNKSDKEACEHVFLSAMIALRDRALKEGGNAVINIKSNYKDNLTTSNTTFQCGAGAIMAGVALVGTVVKMD